MIAYSEGNQHDISHFLEVWAYARMIGEAEGLDERTLKTLELAAVVHDIACPALRNEHGSAPGDLQEQSDPPLVREFFQDSGIDEEMLERICYLVGHHHTYNSVDGLDYQILLEADFLVNATEQEKYRRAVPKFRKNVFKTNFNIVKTRSFISESPQSTSVPMEELRPTIPSSRSRLFFHHGAML